MDSNHARVILKHNKFEVVAIFQFDEKGLPLKTSIDRFGNFDGVMQKRSFVCDLSNYQAHEGLLIPTDIRGCWDFGIEAFYWLHFKIRSVHFE
ncbi:MAG: hypothetical protein H7333_02230 [Bdellovibrionales bacterium]|nr:hypothetical protein [Oligoflexia bacterium]